MLIRQEERIWIFDFDGTISMLVPDPNEATIHPDCKVLLSELACIPEHRVAILSSRRMEDIRSRVDIPNILVGGHSGLEWDIPGKGKIDCEERFHKRLLAARSYIIPFLEECKTITGVCLEDKKWSMAVHMRGLKTDSQNYIFRLLEKNKLDAQIYRGPNVIEVQYLPEVNKFFGYLFLCEILKHQPTPGSTIYAGDDENDATAMKRIIHTGGIAVKVGIDKPLSGAIVVNDQTELVKAIRRLASMNQS